MNKISLNAAVKRYNSEAALPENELKELLAKDEKNYNAEQIEEIYKALKSEKIETKKDPMPHNYNEGLDLEDIDYGNFMPTITVNDDDEEILKATSDFQNYRALEGKLLWNKIYEFDCVRARGQFKTKADGKTRVLIGLKLLGQIKFTTKTEYRHIRDLNFQILNPDTPESNSIYYLLKK